MKTILFFDHTARLGGGEIALLNLVKALDPGKIKPVVLLGSEGKLHERLRKAGIETHLLIMAPSVGDVRKETLGFGTFLHIFSIFKLVIYAARLACFIKRRRADALHCNSLKADILGGVAGRLAGVPVVWHIRDRIAPDYLPPLAAKLFRWLCKVIPDYVIANSAATLVTLGDLPKVNGCVVHDGIPQSFWSPANGAPILPMVGLVGRISPWKGQHIFIEAAHLVHRRFPQARYQIIGSALFGEESYEAEIRRQVKRLGLGGIVEFMGFREDMRKAMGQLEILVHASTTAEPFGQVVAEAMSLGKPVVATQGGGIPEIMEDRGTGLLVPMGDAGKMADAIEWMLMHPEQSKQMGTKGRERILTQFSIEHTARKIEQIHDKLCRHE